MKKIWILLLPLIFIGCVTIEVPEQIRAEFPYERVFDVDFESSIEASSQALKNPIRYITPYQCILNGPSFRSVGLILGY